MKTHLEAWSLRGLLWCFGKLSPGFASTLGGRIARYIGRFLPSSRVAMVNLQRAFPAMSAVEHNTILANCWENLGRTFAELPHLATLPAHPDNGPGWYVRNEHILHHARMQQRPILFFSGHLGNWELMPLVVARYGLAFSPFYRAPNNPLVDRLLCHLRRKLINEPVQFFPKGKEGALEAIRHLAKGGHLGVLGDQKMNDGIEVSFFGHPTMTAPATAALALRFNALIVTGRVWRDGPARLTLEVCSCLDPHMMVPPSSSRQEKIRHLTQHLNDQLESWITERPSDWLWLHRRWEKKYYR